MLDYYNLTGYANIVSRTKIQVRAQEKTKTRKEKNIVAQNSVDCKFNFGFLPY